MRWVYIAIGLFVLGASASMSIQAVGGLNSEAAPGLLAVALILAVGSAAIGHALAGRHTAIAVAILLGMLAGEVAAIVSTAQRVTVSRSATRAPILQAEARRKEASERLERADLAVGRADADVAEKAALPGCRQNCRQLLQDAKDSALKERDSARAALAGLAIPRASATALSEATGIQQWLLDLIEALCVSLAANLPASALIALGVRMRGHREQPAAGPMAMAVSVTEPKVAEPLHSKPFQVALPKPRSAKRSASKEAGQFGIAMLQPSPNGSLSQHDIRRAYLDWCAEMNFEPLPSAEIAPALGKLFRKAGIEVRDGVAVNVALKSISENPATA